MSHCQHHLHAAGLPTQHPALHPQLPAAGGAPCPPSATPPAGEPAHPTKQPCSSSILAGSQLASLPSGLGTAGGTRGGAWGPFRNVTWVHPPMGTHPQGLAPTQEGWGGARASLAMGPPNTQTQGGWKGIQVSWAGRGTGERCQINQEPGGLGSLPSTAERCSGGGTGIPSSCEAAKPGWGAPGHLGPALWAHPALCTLPRPRTQLVLVTGVWGGAEPQAPSTN